MFKKLILATVLLTIVSPSAFADEKKKVPPPKPKIETVRKTFEDVGKELESKDKMGNFEIQRLM